MVKIINWTNLLENYVPENQGSQIELIFIFLEKYRLGI
jgi:hypothetical protein